MAIYYYNSAASGTATGASWTNAFTTLAALCAAMSAGDVGYALSTSNETGLGSTVFTLAEGARIVSVSDTNTPPTTYAAGATVQSTGAGVLTARGGAWFGLHFKGGTATSSAQLLLGGDNYGTFFEDCTFEMVGSGASGNIQIGVISSSAANSYVHTKNCSFTWANTGQYIAPAVGRWQDEGSDFVVGATVPANLFKLAYGFNIECNGSDFSDIAGTLFAAGLLLDGQARLTNCLTHPTGTILGAQTVDGSGEIWLFDCGTITGATSDSSLQYALGHFTYRGNTVVSSSKYVTSDGASYDGTSKHSMVVTGVAASFGQPYFSPWIDAYTAGGVSVTPYFETARDGSATKFNDDEAWAQFMVKTTSNSVKSTLYADRRQLQASASAQATGAGTAAWTGLSGTAASQKLDSGSAVTPAVIGFVRGRVAIATNTTIYVDPKIRGL